VNDDMWASYTDPDDDRWPPISTDRSLLAVAFPDHQDDRAGTPAA
jgi:hypothetical protein